MALSSAARLSKFALVAALGVQLYVHDSLPTAGCQVWPLSSEISTPPTTPPPRSAAVPVIETGEPTERTAPDAGNVIAEDGAIVSVDADE